jgi:hypothetical protein
LVKQSWHKSKPQAQQHLQVHSAQFGHGRLSSPSPAAPPGVAIFYLSACGLCSCPAWGLVRCCAGAPRGPVAARRSKARAHSNGPRLASTVGPESTAPPATGWICSGSTAPSAAAASPSSFQRPRQSLESRHIRTCREPAVAVDSRQGRAGFQPWYTAYRPSRTQRPPKARVDPPKSRLAYTRLQRRLCSQCCRCARVGPARV